MMKAWARPLGIQAGEGGFQLNVKGNTDLKGAVIASSAQAVEAGRNALSTGTLTYSDIDNHAHYDASQLAVSGGVGGAIGKDQQGTANTVHPVPGTRLPSEGGLSVAPPVALSASDQAHSTTHSAISGGVITLTNEAQQHALSGQSADETLAHLNRDTTHASATLAPIFDQEKIAAGFAITRQLANQVGTFVANRAQEAAAAQKAAHDPTLTLEQRAQAQAQADQINAVWGPGGTGQRLATVLTAAASGNVTGSAGQFVQTAGVTYLQTLGAEHIKALAPYLGGEGSPAHTALHAVLGCAGAAASSGNCGAGALGASAGVVLNTALDHLSRTSDALNATEKQARAHLVTSIVTGMAAALNTNAAQALASASVETLFNRQLHVEEKNRITKEANGNEALEKRLTKAACAEVKCWAQYAPGSEKYEQNYVSQAELAGLETEMAWVSQQKASGLFGYTTGQKIGDGAKLAVDVARLPDFVNFQIDYFVGSVWGTFTRDGNSFFGYGVNKAIPNSVNASANIQFGWLNQATVRPEQTNKFVSEYAGTGNVVFGVIGGGIIYSPGNGTATAVGFGVGTNAGKAKNPIDVGMGYTKDQGETGIEW